MRGDVLVYLPLASMFEACPRYARRAARSFERARGRRTHGRLAATLVEVASRRGDR